MTEVQNVNPVNYSTPASVNLNNSILDNNVPMVYEGDVEQPKKRSSGVVKALTTLAILGSGGYLLYRYGAKEKDAILNELEQLKNSEAVKNYEQLKNAKEKVENIVENEKFYGIAGGVSKLKNKIREIFGALKEDTEKVKEDVKELAEDAKNAVEEIKESAEDAAKKA